MQSMNELFGEVISSYSRETAIEDGVLVDVSSVAREAGITFPVALTRAVFEKCVAVPADRGWCSDESGRLWDVVSMLRFAIKRGRAGSQIDYSIRCHTLKGIRRVSLKAICGPGDTAAPVITVMLPDED
jgi:hypothetical protein